MGQEVVQRLFQAQREQVQKAGFHLLGKLPVAPVLDFLGGDAGCAVDLHVHPAHVLPHGELRQVGGRTHLGQLVAL
jgi:hypothetical protein